MHVLVQVEDGELALGVTPHRRGERTRGVVFLPALGDVELGGIAHLEHLQETKGLGDLGVLRGKVELEPRKRVTHGVGRDAVDHDVGLEAHERT